MRALLSTIGSRGDVQPLLALAIQLKALGHQVQLCVPPDFCAWIDSLGFPVTAIGPELRTATLGSPSAPLAPPSPERVRELAESTVSAQFEAVAKAAEGCDVIVAATALQIAARSVAELRGIRYVFVAYCPAVLPSLHHAPPALPSAAGTAPAGTDRGELWARNAARFNDLFGAALNAHRTRLGLAPVTDVRSHVFSDSPWLAADATLAPWPEPATQNVLQTGAWLNVDERPLSGEVQAFLNAGEPPVYFGLGSMRAPREVSRVMIQAARALGRRAIVSRGWAELALVDSQRDCLAVDEINQQALFERVAAVVHHGGAGTTTAAARAGVPQVVIPQMYDQHYWAQRIHELGIGAAHAPGTPSVESLTAALERALQPEIATRAIGISKTVRSDGALAAAERLLST